MNKSIKTGTEDSLNKHRKDPMEEKDGGSGGAGGRGGGASGNRTKSRTFRKGVS